MQDNVDSAEIRGKSMSEFHLHCNLRLYTYILPRGHRDDMGFRRFYVNHGEAEESESNTLSCSPFL